MCGIYASIGLDFNQSSLERIAHRGPDGEGLKIIDTFAGKIVLAHRRLAIIDTDARANQPIYDKKTNSHLILNGEIYNFKEIREQLEGIGKEFITSSDSEVLLCALDTWGLDALEKLRGMFAFIYYDAINQKLLIVRDPYGIKPIYYKQVGNGIAFASEPKQIFDLGDKAKLNRKIAYYYLVNNVTDFSQETFFDNIFQLRGGHYIEIDLKKSFLYTDIRPKRWYKIPKQMKSNLGRENAHKEFKEKFEREIKLHLQSDVPIGSCLSGGLDSSVIVGAATQISGEKLETFSAVFLGEKQDESEFIYAAVEKNKSHSNEVKIDEANLLENLKKIIWHQDEPFGSCSIILQYYVFKKVASRKIKVVLDGQGADEQLAGYHGLFDFILISQLRQFKIFDLIKTIIERKKLQGTGIFVQLNTIIGAVFHKFGQKAKAAPYFEDAPIFKKEYNNLIQEAIKRDELFQIKSIGSQCYLLAFATSLPMLLRFEDRNSMAFGIEARVPFVGRDLIEFSLELGDIFKIEGARTKSILRDSLAQYLPKKIIDRHDKIGFAPPEEKWLRGVLLPALEVGIEKFIQKFPDLLNNQGLRNVLDSFIAGGEYDGILWRAANIGLWAEAFDIE